MPNSAKEKLKSKLKKKSKKKRRFKGWKANLSAQTEEFSVNVPIRYKKISSKTIDEAMNIERFTADGQRVKRKMLGENAHFGYITEDGTEISHSEVVHKQNIDGEWKRVEKFSKTKTMEITNFVEKEKLWNYLLEKFYEVWGEENGLWLLADYLQQNGKIAVCDHIVLRKSFKEYYGLIFPVVQEDKYTLVMALTRMNLSFEHLRPAKPVSEPQEPEEPEEEKRTPKSQLRLDF